MISMFGAPSGAGAMLGASSGAVYTPGKMSLPAEVNLGNSVH